MFRDPPHYLKALKTSRVPDRLAFLDCAGVARQEQGMDVMRWGVGALILEHVTSRAAERRQEHSTHHDTAALWDTITEFCARNRRVVLWAYDLPQQLRISRALIELAGCGWKLDKIVLERQAAWSLHRLESRSLMCVDLRSWIPADWPKIAADAGQQMTELAQPQPDGDPRQAACQQRAQILAHAVRQILNFLERETCGPFRPTGSGQSYAAFRRRFLSHKLLVHDDVERLAVERMAMWTGRCEAWRHGPLRGGPFVEVDMTSAYAQIASQCDVPTVAAGPLLAPSIEQLQRESARFALLCQIRVRTDVECVPCQAGERTVWPVGEFTTWVWDPELRLAVEHAQSVECLRAYRYKRAPVLADFADWILAGVEARGGEHGPIAGRVLKHWSRTMVGRLGLRFRSWEPFGEAPFDDLRLITYLDLQAGTSTDMLHAGRQQLILGELSEATESVPQVPGWIMSECRRRLWEAMTLVGRENVVYVDTDSMIVAPIGRGVLSLLDAAGAPWPWHLKGSFKSLAIHGPRNITLQGSRRVAGVPRTARQRSELEFTGQVMRSIKESMRSGQLDHVASIPRRFVMSAPDLRRQHVEGGHTIPYRVGE